MATPPPRPPRLELLPQDPRQEDTLPGIHLQRPPLPPGLPRISDPVTIPSPFPPGSLTPPAHRKRPWRWGALASALLLVAGEVAHAVYPALTGPLELLGRIVQSVE